MINVKTIETDFENKKSEHTLYYQDNSTCLVVVFPGGNNSCNRPILHYIRHFSLQNNCDVLNISYTNLVNSNDSWEIQLERLVESIMTALNQITLNKKYDKTLFVSRSAGNIISNELKINKSLNVDKCVYISPTSEATKYFDSYPGLIITGTNDPYISDEEIQKLVEQYEPNIVVIKEGGHGLESEHIVQTLDFCKEAVVTIMNYLFDEGLDS